MSTTYDHQKNKKDYLRVEAEVSVTWIGGQRVLIEAPRTGRYICIVLRTLCDRCHICYSRCLFTLCCFTYFALWH